MAWSYAWGGSPNVTASYTSGNRFVFQDQTWPNGNPGLDGVSRVYLESITAAYASGGTGVYAAAVKDGALTQGGTWHAPNGVFQFRIGHTGGTQYFGRNTNIGATIGDSNGGAGWSGALPGSMTYGTYPSQCQAISVTRGGRNVGVVFSGPANDGGFGLTHYVIQYTTNGGATWGGDVAVSNGSYTFLNLPPSKTYYFRVYAVNGLGAGFPITSGAVFVPAGGKRQTASGPVATTIAKRATGPGTFVDLSIAKRLTASGWVDLS